MSGSAQGGEVVVTVALCLTASITIRAGNKEDMAAQIKEQLTLNNGEDWQLEKFAVREANVQAAAFADAFKIRHKRPATVRVHAKAPPQLILGPVGQLA